MLNRITKISFISLATIPLLKENLNSLLIIVCVLLTIINLIQLKPKITFDKKVFIVGASFWLYLLYELISGSMSSKIILLHLPFLIFPFLYYVGVNYLQIDDRIKRMTIKTFQISTLLQSIIYVVFFLSRNPLDKFFAAENNIPFFREYVAGHYWFNIHPTYFSSFLLVSFTISLLAIFNKKQQVFNIVNSVFMLFFILLFSSRMIFILMILSFLIILGIKISKAGRKQKTTLITSSVVIAITLLYPFQKILGKRLQEITTEINKPVSGEYYNSTNTRIAIFKCTYSLLKEVPVLGYGSNFQKELDNCYEEKYPNSVFYKKQQFNTHNYYLHLIGYGGWFFLLLFIVYLAYVFKYAKTSLLGIILLFQFLSINMTENYFSRHYGIVLFSFFMSLLIFIPNKNTEVSS
ncbi:O-antigen ligase family protein [Tenacibaculum amylolyticum]|uniref:O-antigen ligase family protein n=1 Tax=Tenacibaculum amylolyticum TaxID=104269 RepID=UPI003893CE4C